MIGQYSGSLGKGNLDLPTPDHDAIGMVGAITESSDTTIELDLTLLDPFFDLSPRT
jgi:hypothetical protein